MFAGTGWVESKLLYERAKEPKNRVYLWEDA